VFRRRKLRRDVSPDLREAFVRFRRTVAAVEEAKETLAAAAPRGRSSGVPLAEALAAFEQGLRDASASMPSWRRPEVENVWRACGQGLEEASRGAEGFRMAEMPKGYEQLYGELADLMEPLDAFAAALERFRDLGL
jgi:exonuclease VII small subunit